jgi:hypothetical protein
MADLPPGTGDDAGVGTGDGSPPDTPRWVKVFGTIVTVVILLFIILRFTVFAGH